MVKCIQGIKPGPAGYCKKFGVKLYINFLYCSYSILQCTMDIPLPVAGILTDFHTIIIYFVLLGF